MLRRLKRFFGLNNSDTSVSKQRVILIGIDYPSHELGSALQQLGHEVIAFIDDEPWNHRTKMLGATVHYPSEVAALAARYNADRVVKFKGASIELPAEVQEHLKQLNLSLIVIDAKGLDIEVQVGQALDPGK